MSVFRWASGFLLGQSGWLLGGVVVLGLAAGAWLGNALQHRETLRVSAEHAEYQTQVLRYVASENAKVSEALSDLAKTQQRLQVEIQEQRRKDEAFSDNLIKELQRENGKSCPLSPATERYITSLLNREQVGRP